MIREDHDDSGFSTVLSPRGAVGYMRSTSTYTTVITGEKTQ